MPSCSLRDRATAPTPPILIAALAAWFAAAAVAFRSSLLTSFAMIFGNNGDGRLIAYLHEHLFAALMGRTELLSPAFYFPQPNVLGYTDAFLLDALPYAGLRELGLDPFLASQFLAIALSLCCFTASFMIGLRYLRLGPTFATCAAALATFPSNLMFKTAEAHPNFFALYYVPCLVLLALWAVEDFPSWTKWSLLRAGGFGLGYGLLFATSFYVAWLFALTLLFGLGTLAVLRGREAIALLRRHPGSCAALIGAAIAGFAIGAIPLMMIYLPALQQHAGRSFRDYVGFAPFPTDLINVGLRNLMWGWLVERLIGEAQHERALAVTPLMTAALMILLLRLRRAAPGRPMPWQLRFASVCVAVWGLSWLVTLRVGTFSAFWLPYHLVPGAVAIRGGDRIQLLVNLWIVAGLVVMLQYWLDCVPRAAGARRRLIAGVVVALCLIEQINLQPTGLARRDELARLASVPAAPPQCGAFMVDAGTPSDGKQWDAMWISAKLGLPTLNGDSGWAPPGWRLNDPTIDYDEAVRLWIAKTNLDVALCRYDRSTRQWSAYPLPADEVAADRR
ncbi:MAG: hypothetical protein QM576_03500 [Rhodopseudomonas sp.]|uniref:hypothetical protein n=1 Tax=Rhodopseudomonas sp. TaxID=1078 RepID=UPI0039E25650